MVIYVWPSCYIFRDGYPVKKGKKAIPRLFLLRFRMTNGCDYDSWIQCGACTYSPQVQVDLDVENIGHPSTLEEKSCLFHPSLEKKNCKLYRVFSCSSPLTWRLIKSGMLKKTEKTVTGAMYMARCFHRGVVRKWMRYLCGLQMAKWRSNVNATIINTDAHMDTWARTSEHFPIFEIQSGKR